MKRLFVEFTYPKGSGLRQTKTAIVVLKEHELDMRGVVLGIRGQNLIPTSVSEGEIIINNIQTL